MPYGESPGKNKKLHPVITLQCKRVQTQKERCKCPFEICDSPQGKVKMSTTPDIFCNVKLSGCVYEHNCSMDTHSHRLAFQVNGQNCADLSRINHVIRMLWDKSSLPNHMIQPKIAHVLPPNRFGCSLHEEFPFTCCWLHFEPPFH
jgi:hypothetical protein